MTVTVFGLDGEMSAADLAAGGRLIQIGLAAHLGPDGTPDPAPAVFSSLVNPGPDLAWDDRAAAVHGYALADVHAAPPAADVDAAACSWLAAHALAGERRGIAVGFNVGAFDLPHLAAVLPRTARLFSRRTIDLNALCFTLDGLPYGGASAPSWSGWKRMATTYAEREIAASAAHAQSAHDAGYDALLHLHAWRFLRAAAHGTPLPIRQEPVTGYSRDVQAALGALLAAIGLPAAVTATGYPPATLKGWANGGRVTDPAALDRVRAALADQPRRAS